ncbi:hypothetical protein HYH03_010117 [Edaphochlamys debaryana]|uniref:CUE domain-containing protein n=1 Tax=Edaphochlamys debaryana TaxID=47281 RepID=A0A836BWB3_9CHLO|nr:hypothetical protein HYH03_010117 [Edaphochlamys debaryana]|eukprot:KAG2491546.1 hypothetical protein HYH03_010117 [Edaphochlamys debaryana]
MSVLSVPSPVLAKRHFDEGEAGEGFDRHLGGKRSRQHYSPAAARCQFAAGGVHAVPPTTLSALLALFPGMDERTVSSVLSECGNNIDAAIRRLGELRLATGSGEEAGPSSPPPPANARTEGPAGTPSASAPGVGTPGPSSDAAAAAAAAAASEAEAAAAASGPQTAEQWVEVLVAEMAAASDLTNARQRAAGFLRQFEAFVARLTRQQVEASGSTAARAAKLAEENAVLKKAVQIQHRQLQERAGLEAEVAALKAHMAQQQEQLRTLQVSNYSLSLHLKNATQGAFVDMPRNPDVF